MWIIINNNVVNSFLKYYNFIPKISHCITATDAGQKKSHDILREKSIYKISQSTVIILCIIENKVFVDETAI